MKLSKGGVIVNLVVGDITEFSGDAIVNPANRYLVMGGGVAGAIKRKGGEEIEKEARRYAPIDIGQAVVTSAGRLKCRAVIHAPTVETPGGSSSPEYVYRATLAALRIAKERGFKSIAFPLMGAGVGGLTPEQSVEAMAKAFEEIGQGLEIYIYVLREDALKTVAEHLKKLGWVEA
ncbi:MAG: macro domain-containing protein [Ignisphaera sp.]|nr:macro domain-containing protein [Ignisphaera sp.]